MSRDPVRPEDHAALIIRDQGCVLRGVPGHSCRDVFGDYHSPLDVGRCTIEHVKKDSRMGKRAPSRLPFMVLLCGATNNKPPSHAEREVMRAYLRLRYPEAWA